MTNRRLLVLVLFAFLSSCVHAQSTPTLVQTVTPSPVAESHPWWENAVFYEIFVRSFYDTDGNGIGDFNGITQKLDYLKDLGITAIWLMPIHPSPSYHGYDVINHDAVNPEYGTIEDFKNLLEEAHDRDIRIIIDLVLNHTSNQHPWFIDANSNLESKYRDYYVWSDKAGNRWHQGENGYYFGLFGGHMPDLNYRNPDVTADIFKVTDYWLNEIGVDGFRVDAAKHLIEEDSKVEHTKSTHEWYQKFYEYYKSLSPNAYTVGEAFGAGAFVTKTYENQFDHIFNFELGSAFISSARTGTNTPINSAIRFALKDSPEFNFATFLTNHDQDRVMSVLDGDIKEAKIAAFLLLTSQGTPFIYYGEEIGMQGRKPDEDIRLPMQWNSKANAGFTTGTPWRVVNADHVQVNVAEQEKSSHSLLNHYRKLIQLRGEHSALQTGETFLVETGTSRIYANLRTDGAESLLVLANLGSEAISDYSLTLREAVFMDKTYGAEVLFGGGEASALQVTQGGFQNYRPVPQLGPYSMLIIRFGP